MVTVTALAADLLDGPHLLLSHTRMVIYCR
jgi:hypothetical protein